MNTPDLHPENDHDPFAYDARLRAHFDEAAQTPPPPPAGGWAQVQARLQPAPAPQPASRRAPLLATGVSCFVLGLLLMWLQQPVAVPAGPASTAPASASLDTSRSRSGTVSASLDASRNHSGTVSASLDTFRNHSGTVSASLDRSRNRSGAVSALLQHAPGRSIALAQISGPVSGLGAPTVPTVLTSLVLTETTYAAVPPDSARPFRERRRAALLAQRAELARLRYRTDSLLLGLGEGPAMASVEAATDTTSPPHHLTTSNRWSVALTFAPERNFFGLSSPVSDTLSALRRTHETGRAGYNAALLAEYRVNHRLSVGAGIGMSTYGGELRLTDHRTTITTKVDTIRSTATATSTVTTRAWAIRQVADSILSPILNINSQVIGYRYLPTTRLDTVWTNLVNTRITTSNSTTYTPTITTRQELRARVLRPNYRFLTVPVVLRYRLGRATDWTSSPTAPRWWADVAVGAQVQFFLGGTQLTTRDGLTYQTERIGPRGGPFRPVNVALTGAVAFNYALTPRLSASLAPTVRYQPESVYKASTNLTQRPTATGVQMGLKLAF